MFCMLYEQGFNTRQKYASVDVTSQIPGIYKPARNGNLYWGKPGTNQLWLSYRAHVLTQRYRYPIQRTKL